MKASNKVDRRSVRIQGGGGNIGCGWCVSLRKVHRCTGLELLEGNILRSCRIKESRKKAEKESAVSKKE